MTDLRAYVQHLPTCAVWDCQHCGWNQRMHDAAEDIDEVTCIREDKDFTPKTKCTCGLEAALAAPPPQPLTEAQILGLRDYVNWHGAAHVEDCPGDDTCDCIGKPLNDAVTSILSESFDRAMKGAALAAEPPDPHIARRQLPILKKLHAPAEVIEEAERLAAAPPPQQDEQINANALGQKRAVWMHPMDRLYELVVGAQLRETKKERERDLQEAKELLEREIGAAPPPAGWQPHEQKEEKENQSRVDGVPGSAALGSTASGNEQE